MIKNIDPGLWVSSEKCTNRERVAFATLFLRFEYESDFINYFDGFSSLIFRKMDIRIIRDFCIRMAQGIANYFNIDTFLKQAAGERMPLRYNYDKPEKPRRIKGFEVFSLVFSSFSKPKNHTEISRIIGGVSLTTNE